MSWHLTRDRSCDSGQQLPCFYTCQFTIIWMSIIRLQALTLDRKFDISHWFPRGADRQVDGRTGVRSRDYQNFSDG